MLVYVSVFMYKIYIVVIDEVNYVGVSNIKFQTKVGFMLIVTPESAILFPTPRTSVFSKYTTNTAKSSLRILIIFRPH